MSIELGKFNQLEVVKEVDFGVYLDGGEEGEILLPTRYVPEDCKIGDFLNVFLYLVEMHGPTTSFIPGGRYARRPVVTPTTSLVNYLCN